MDHEDQATEHSFFQNRRAACLKKQSHAIRQAFVKCHDSPPTTFLQLKHRQANVKERTAVIDFPFPTPLLNQPHAQRHKK
jgi:hypothetical protein